MPTLYWTGKDKVIGHHREVPCYHLEHQYGYAVCGQQPQPAATGNMLIQGDNLEVLRSLLPQYEGRIKCIYIDPPYNTGSEGWIYNDNMGHPHIRQWLEGLLSGGTEAPIHIDELSRHDKWLCMMYPRLRLMHALLASDGAIFMSIDDHEAAHLRLLADEIFGAAHFVGQYHWLRSATPSNLSGRIKKNLEYILCYTKSGSTRRFSGIKKESRSPDPLTKPKNSLKTLRFPPGAIHIRIPDQVVKKGLYGTARFPHELLNDLVIEGGRNKNEVAFRNRFTWVQAKLDEELRHGTGISISAPSLVLSYKKTRYSREAPPSLINGSTGVHTAEQAGRELRRIFREKTFDYPKPASLLEYLINFFCDKDAIVLDCFAGSGTTAHAVLNLNKRDGGNRQFILVEMETYAESITAERIRRVIQGYGATEGTGGGFNYYTLGREAR